MLLIFTFFQAVRALHLPSPRLRLCAAEHLYECLASECDSSDEDERNRRLKLLSLLSETKWGATGDEQYFVKVSRVVGELWKIPL